MRPTRLRSAATCWSTSRSPTHSGTVSNCMGASITRWANTTRRPICMEPMGGLVLPAGGRPFDLSSRAASSPEAALRMAAETPEGRAIRLGLFQLLRMVAQMIRHESLYEVIAVIITWLHAQAEHLTGLGGRRGEYLRLQLLGQKLIRRALVDEDRPRKRPARDQLAGVVVAPALGIGSQIIAKRLFPPRGLHRRRNGRERGNRFIPVRIAQCAHQRTVSAHGMAENSGRVGSSGKIGGNELRQLARDITVHPIVLRPRGRGRVHIEAGRIAE